MININLLPVRQIKQRIRARNELFALLGALALILIIMGLTAYSQSREITQINQKTAVLQAEKNKYRAIVSQINHIKKEQERLNYKLKAIETLNNNAHLPVRIMDAVARLTPSNRMWLNSMQLSSNTLSLQGTALDNATIAQYMERLKASPFFHKPQLQNSSLVKMANKKLKKFSLLMTLNKP